jgi:hypothetical protein
MSAQNQTGATIAVVLGGTPVSLPNNQVLNSFTVGGGNTNFTAAQSGLYFVTYEIHTTVDLALSSRVTLNGTAIPASVYSPILSSDFSNSFFVTLTAGDVLELQLFGFLGVAILQDGAGATLNVIRLS